MKLGQFYWIALAGSVILLSACHDGNGGNQSSSAGSSILSAECSGSYGEQLACYANKYIQMSQSDMNNIYTRCQKKDFPTKNGELAECKAVLMVMKTPKAVKWIGKPEPYPSRNWEFFLNTSDQIRIDENSWCIAQWYVEGNLLGGRHSQSCNSLANISLHSPGEQTYAKIGRMNAGSK